MVSSEGQVGLTYVVALSLLFPRRKSLLQIVKDQSTKMEKMTSEIEFLEPVDIRRVWAKEDKSFTPWIAKPDVMAKLLDQCGIDYDGELTIRQEVPLPGYKRKLDVLVESTSGDKIAIENQFNEADHDHMTRALAYAVSFEAKAVILIAESFRPEFVDLAEYLNGSALAFQEHGIPVFLVAIELFTAPSGGSYFPKFQVAARPNEWKATLFQGTHNPGTESDRELALFNFHDRTLDDVRQATGIFRNVKSLTGNWKAGSFGISGVQIAYMVAKEVTTASIWFHTRSPKANIAGLTVLKQNAAEIQKELHGRNLTWREQETSSLDVPIEGIGWGSESPESRKELLEILAILTSTAKKYITEMRDAINFAEN